jgi:hypothetical protein
MKKLFKPLSRERIDRLITIRKKSLQNNKDRISSSNKLIAKSVIEEYKCHRVEINLHLSNEQEILKMTFALIVGTVTASQLIPLITDPKISNLLWPLLLIASFIFSSFTLMLLGETLFIAELSSYITDVLRPKMESLFFIELGKNEDIWNWGEYYYNRRFKSFEFVPFSIIVASKFSITTLPSIIALIYYYFQRPQRTFVPIWETILFLFVILILVLMIITMGYTFFVYKTGAKEKKII